MNAPLTSLSESFFTATKAPSVAAEWMDMTRLSAKKSAYEFFDARSRKEGKYLMLQYTVCPNEKDREAFDDLLFVKPLHEALSVVKDLFYTFVPDLEVKFMFANENSVLFLIPTEGQTFHHRKVGQSLTQKIRETVGVVFEELGFSMPKVERQVAFCDTLQFYFYRCFVLQRAMKQNLREKMVKKYGVEVPEDFSRRRENVREALIRANIPLPWNESTPYVGSFFYRDAVTNEFKKLSHKLSSIINIDEFAKGEENPMLDIPVRYHS